MRTVAVLLAGLALLGCGLWTARSLSDQGPTTDSGPGSVAVTEPAATAAASLRSTDPATAVGAPAVATPSGTSNPATGTPVDLPPTRAPAVDRTTAEATASAPIGALRLGQSARGGRLGVIYELVELRTGEHGGFTRVVWELATADKSQGESAPLWEAVQQRNDQEPKAAGLLDGSCHIRLRLADTYAMNVVGSLNLDAPAGGAINGIRILPVEDDSSLVFAVDLAEPAPYTVTVLQAPLRIVIDVYRP